MMDRPEPLGQPVRMFDMIVLMRSGRIEQVGPLREIYSRPTDMLHNIGCRLAGPCGIVAEQCRILVPRRLYEICGCRCAAGKAAGYRFRGRYEHYTDAENAETGKIAAHYDFIKWFAIRDAINTGFRAPTLAEEHYSTRGMAPTNAGG